MEKVTLKELEKVFKHYTPREKEAPHRIPSAVLIPFLEKEGKLHLLFMRKVEDNSHHSGQVSFPGGAYEEEDRDLLTTALRETQEELGVSPQSWRILGRLEAIETRGTPYIIYPFVGYLVEETRFVPNPQEVARVFTVPLDYILELHPFEPQELEWKGRIYQTFIIPYQGETIWGATARILDLLCHLIKGTVADEEPRRVRQR